MNRAYYSASVEAFMASNADTIIGRLVRNSSFSVEATQRDAWLAQIEILRQILTPHRSGGSVYFEFSVPRLGKRIDVVLVIGPAIFVLEFKVGERDYAAHAIDQVYDYALDLKNFHESTHGLYVAPVLIATRAPHADPVVTPTHHNDRLFVPILSTVATLDGVFRVV